MSRKLYIKTFGCQMNEYDSARMADLLKATHGMETVATAEEADVLLLNTCSIREKAQDKVFSELGVWNELKQARPEIVIGVGGCVASQEGDVIIKRAPFVNVVFGPQTLHRLPALIARNETTRKPAVDVSFPEIEKFDCLPEPQVDGPRAMVSIMEGCSKYCSFCVVPYTRGEEFSRPFDDVIAEIARLAARGAREIVLLGQNVNGYRGAWHDRGRDDAHGCASVAGGRTPEATDAHGCASVARGTTPAATGVCDFATLLYHVAEIDGIERIRYTTSHPREFSDALIAAYADIPQLVSHVHLPVQSGSDRILAAMKRGHTVLEYKSKLRKLRAVRPDISISTDIIVGFPGETAADFEQTLALMDEMQFDLSYCFIYSARPGTPAAQLCDDTPMEEKRRRLEILQRRNMEMAGEIARALIGTRQRILVNRPARKGVGMLAGRAENNRVVNFAHADASLIGRFVDVEITEVMPNSLRGKFIALAERAIVRDRADCA